MASNDHSANTGRRAVLRSGNETDVAGPRAAAHGGAGHAGPLAPNPPSEDADLHICRHCASGLCHPVEWERAGPERWLLSLRCPNCEWTGSGVFSEAAIDGFDEELERGSQALLDDLERVARANMAEEIARFIAALKADALLPSDF